MSQRRKGQWYLLAGGFGTLTRGGKFCIIEGLGNKHKNKVREMKDMQRQDKVNYYLDIAQTVLARSTCLRRHYGAIVVKNDEIISTGYNGAPRGRKNCMDLNYCTREAMKIPSGQRYELCRSVHAEANAIISASRSELLGATLYMACRNPSTGEIMANSTCCSMCRRLIINAGIDRVIIRNTATEYDIVEVSTWIDEDDTIAGAAPAPSGCGGCCGGEK